jgi:hypothetical protein
VTTKPLTRPASPAADPAAGGFPEEVGFFRRWYGFTVNGARFARLLLWPTRRNRYFAFGKFRRLYFIHFRRRRLDEVLLARRGGACRQCGACCQLGYVCYHYDPERRGCRVYSHRPTICRVFPIDEKDLIERDAVMPGTRCGFTFPNYRPPAKGA